MSVKLGVFDYNASDAAPSELQVSSGNESSEEEPKVKTKETAKLTVPKGDLKKRTAKSPRKPKNKEEAKDKEKEPNKKGAKRTGYRRKRVLVDECREEKAPYVKVREARMVTLANKVSSSFLQYVDLHLTKMQALHQRLTEDDKELFK